MTLSPPDLDQIAFADRLVLARLGHDHDAMLTIIEEVGACPECWRSIAIYLCGLAATLAADRPDAATFAEHLTNRIAELLDAIEEEGHDE